MSQGVNMIDALNYCLVEFACCKTGIVNLIDQAFK